MPSLRQIFLASMQLAAFDLREAAIEIYFFFIVVCQKDQIYPGASTVKRLVAFPDSIFLYLSVYLYPSAPHLDFLHFDPVDP